ncbi:unnamed protein product [Haemonchus placei]|uniref:Uncharacterized protein n=1 Tax=Haemonchus placei TaxID=6290 RepID=A0A0N4WT42_HAEPC|nr:unnamed protein product [Haemonchus placei]
MRNKMLSKKKSQAYLPSPTTIMSINSKNNKKKNKNNNKDFSNYNKDFNNNNNKGTTTGNQRSTSREFDVSYPKKKTFP